MENKTWLANYNALNSSFDKTLVFRVGIEAGFFSEINHMLMAVLFCLKNKIKFELSSKENNFAYQKGWDDYFIPFCKESLSDLHLKYNARSYQIKVSVPNVIKLKLIRKYLNVQYLTQDIWPYIKDAKFYNESFNIPSLDIDSDFLHAMHVLSTHIWRYELKTEKLIRERLKVLGLPSSYIGVHIRSGDIEKKNYAVSSYIDLVKSLSVNKNLFVATDNYSNIKQIKTQFPDYTIYTYCKEKETGFNEGTYNNMSKNAKRETLIDLLTDTEALYQSEIFVGTLSSNVGVFVGMRRMAKLWYGIDANEWRMC